MNSNDNKTYLDISKNVKPIVNVKPSRQLKWNVSTAKDDDDYEYVYVPDTRYSPPRVNEDANTVNDRYLIPNSKSNRFKNNRQTPLPPILKF